DKLLFSMMSNFPLFPFVSVTPGTKLRAVTYKYSPFTHPPRPNILSTQNSSFSANKCTLSSTLAARYFRMPYYPIVYMVSCSDVIYQFPLANERNMSVLRYGLYLLTPTASNIRSTKANATYTIFFFIGLPRFFYSLG